MDNKKTVESIMTQDVVRVRPETPLTEAARILRDHQFNGLPVVNEKNVLVGIVTEFDLITKGSALHLPTLQKVFQSIPVESSDHFQEELKKIAQLRVQDVMNSEPLAVRSGMPLEDVVRAFAEHHRVNPIPVVDEFLRVVGIVSRADLLKLFIGVQKVWGANSDAHGEVLPTEVLAERALSFLQSDYMLVDRLVEQGHDFLQENQQLFQSLVATVADSKDFTQALAMVAEKLCAFSDWVAAEIWMPGVNNKRLELLSTWHKDAPELLVFIEKSQSFTFALGEGLPGRAWNLRKPLWARDVSAEPEGSFLQVKEARDAGIHAAVAIPVIIAGEVVAVLLFFMLGVRAEDERFVDVAANFVGYLDTFLRGKFMEDTSAVLRRSMESSVDAVIITTPEPSIVYVNPAWERLNGYTLEEVRGKNPNMLHSGKTPSEVYERLWKALGRGDPFVTEEIVNKKKDGTEYAEEITISPIMHNGSIAFYMGIVRDVTKRKERERERGELVSLTAHQLRSPLTSISWNVEALLKEKLGKERAEYLEEIFGAQKTMAEVVDTFLNAAKLEGGTFAVHPMSLDVQEYAERSVRQVARIAKEKSIQVEAHYALSSAKVMLDPVILGIVLQNFLSNAVKYTREGGTVTLDIAEKDDQLIIQVADTGWGIPAEEQTKIFTKLFRASNIREQIPSGTGLGLYILKMAVEKAGGSVGFVSEVGKGSTFWVSFSYISNSS